MDTKNFARGARFGVRRLDAAFACSTKSRSSIEIRRCQPLLGTFVEITASGAHPAEMERAIETGFSAIAKVHRLMSFHQPESDVSRMNRHAYHKAVRVHRWTWRVLKSAQRFSCDTDGIFDVTMAGQLVNWKYLPGYGGRFGRGSWRDIILQAIGYVRFRRPLLVDFGGIAKGFAVDRAVEALKRGGVLGGIVNAGGDLRVFGSARHLVHLRHPAQPNCAAGALKLRDRAIATSGIYFTQKKNRGRSMSPILNARTRQAARHVISVTVGAANCVTADALTKAVFALRERAAPLLALYSADALLLEQNGEASWMFHPPSARLQRTGSQCDASRQT